MTYRTARHTRLPCIPSGSISSWNSLVIKKQFGGLWTSYNERCLKLTKVSKNKNYNDLNKTCTSMIKWFGCCYGSKRPTVASSFTSTDQCQRTRFDLNFRILWAKIIQILWMVTFSTLFCCTAFTFKFFFFVKWALIPFCSYEIHFYINIHGYKNNKCILFLEILHTYIYVQGSQQEIFMEKTTT